MSPLSSGHPILDSGPVSVTSVPVLSKASSLSGIYYIVQWTERPVSGTDARGKQAQAGGSQKSADIESLRSSEGFCPGLVCLCFFLSMWFLKTANSTLENTYFGFVQVSKFCSAHSAVY